MVSKFLHACTCDVDCVFAWFMFYSSHIIYYIYVCVWDENANATTGIKTHIQIQPVLSVGCADWNSPPGKVPARTALPEGKVFSGWFSLKSTGWFLEAQPRLPGGNTSFISFMSFLWVSRDLKRSQESSHLGLRGGEPAEEGDLDLVDRVAYRSSRSLDAKCQESEWDQNEMEGWEGNQVSPLSLWISLVSLFAQRLRWRRGGAWGAWLTWLTWMLEYGYANWIFGSLLFSLKMSVSSYLILFILCSQGLQESVCVHSLQVCAFRHSSGWWFSWADRVDLDQSVGGWAQTIAVSSWACQ